VAVFRRGDSIVVVAGYDVRAVTGGRRRSGSDRVKRERERQVTRVEAALVLAKDESAPLVVVKGTSQGPAGVTAAIAPAEPALLSLETLDTGDSTHAARARYWLPVAPRPAGVALSDPLLLRAVPDDSLHPSLADVIPLARSQPQGRRGERIGVFWETYGLERSNAPFRVTMTVSQAGRSWMRKAAEWAGLTRRDPRYVSIGWEEPPRPGVAVYPRVIGVSMPEAGPGTYVLEIVVAVPEEPVARVSREITILPD
jgi:hypothetical protein